MSGYGFWLSAAGMKVNEHRQAVHANNMANSNTTGFKQDLAMVMQRDIESVENAGGARLRHPVLDQLAGGLNVRQSTIDFSQGPIENTRKPLDVALQGKGFFSVSDGKTTQYTRNGEFAINRESELVMSGGDGKWRVLGDDGRPISLASDGGPLRIADDGTIRQGKNVVAKLGFFVADNEKAMRKAGENLFDASKTEMKSINATVRSGAIEGSNFSAIKGLSAMIEATRAYQLNATMIQLQDQVTGQAVTTVGRVA